ncbi:cytochrome c peroxidase [Longitalea luteola]|uniref:cytochrome c peroxidase n=1 Tax=Longitalea luteola TaxID=2812563 RepID=UPI001A969614|nr:cytochrome c peroxidase [Longitalea luteola]
MKPAARLITAVFILLICFSACFNKEEAATGEPAAKALFNAQMDSLITSLLKLDTLIKQGADTPVLRPAFVTSRHIYKRAEAITEYYFQGLTRRINGPALPDIKTEDGQVWPPHGFQVIEQYLYGSFHDSLRPTVSNEVNLLITDLRFVKANMPHHAILPRHARELVQHQLIRIATLGITGFDAPVSFQSLPESAEALKGIQLFCRSYIGAQLLNDSVPDRFDNSINYLLNHRDFNSFDRLVFITDHLMPLSRLLDQRMAVAAGKDTLALSKPFYGTFADLMEGRAWNPDFYAGYAKAVATKEKIALGKQLFADPRLSASGAISCASCHKEKLAFTDGLPKAGNLVHGGSLPRNTPTLYYAALQAAQFYDLRSTSLEDQVNEVMSNTNEFALDARATAEKLLADPAYRSQLSAIYGADKKIGGYEIRNAIAAYVRSLNPFASRFDDYLRGQQQQLTTQEIHGFNLFMGKAKCGTCHFMPLFNGTIPPWFTKSESEIIGVPAKPLWQQARIDGDSGRYAINQIPELLYSLKTPGIRNSSRTAPYMHNGVYTSLNEVVQFYNKGGGSGIGIELPHQSLPFDSLSLTTAEQEAIVAFLGALTDN